MTLIRGQATVEDTWRSIADADPIPADGDVIVSLTRFLEALDALRGREGRLGVQLRAEDDAQRLAGSLEHLALVAIDFPTFKDGRGYSQAMILRQQLGFQGTLRATGDVLHDQLFFMARCGLDEFMLKDDKDPSLALEAFSTFSNVYQDAADGRPVVPTLRRDEAR